MSNMGTDPYQPLTLISVRGKNFFHWKKVLDFYTFLRSSLVRCRIDPLMILSVSVQTNRSQLVFAEETIR